MKYRSDKTHIYLTNTPFTQKDTLKEKLSGVWFDTKKGKGYRFPKNLQAYRELYKAFPELKDAEKFIDDGKLAASDISFWQMIKNEEHSEDGLRSYQSQDMYYLKSRGSCLVLNEPRTGKTPTVIKTMAALNMKKNLVVCPSSLVFNWAKEFKIWHPEMEVVVVTGTPKQREKAYQGRMTGKFVMIISKDTLKADIDKRTFDFDVVVVDEAHFLRNYKSAQSKAIFKLKAKIKYALTGTPTVKHAVDVYGLLHFINPDAFSSYWQFADRYFQIDDNGWGKDIGKAKAYREEELRNIMALNSVQRKRKEVMKWLPDAQHQTIPVVMTKKQVKLYDQMFDTFMATDKENEVEVDTLNKLSQLMRLRQLCLDPRLLGFDEVGTKTTALLEFAEDNVDPFVVMTTFSSYFKLIKPELEKLGKKVGIIDGSVSKQKKMDTAESFQKGRYDVLLCNIIAAGTGFTLDRADTILFLDKDFNPANNEQAQDRIVPTTKERYHNINIISLVVEGSIDERVNEILDNKEDLTKLINKPEIFA